MANTVREQIAVCEKVATFKTAKGDKEVYTFRLDNQTFDVWENQHFKAREGEKYHPVVFIGPSAYTYLKDFLDFLNIIFNNPVNP
jgi:hypothetical protein